MCDQSENSQVLPTFSNQGGQSHACPQLPGTILRIFIPAGAAINLLNLIEVASPGGICLIVRIPLLGGETGGRNIFSDIMNAVQSVGGTVEVN